MTESEKVYVSWKDWSDLKEGIIRVIQDEIRPLTGRITQLEELHTACRSEMEPIAREHNFVKKILFIVLTGNGILTGGGVAAVLKNPDILKEILKLF